MPESAAESAAAPDGLEPVMDARRAVEGASALYKATVEVARRHGYSVQEIADAAGVTRQAIYALLRERAALREREPVDVACADNT